MEKREELNLSKYLDERERDYVISVNNDNLNYRMLMLIWYFMMFIGVALVIIWFFGFLFKVN